MKRKPQSTLWHASFLIFLSAILCMGMAPAAGSQDMKAAWEQGRREWQTTMGSFYQSQNLAREQAQWNKKWDSYRQPSNQGSRTQEGQSRQPASARTPAYTDPAVAGREYSDELLRSSREEDAIKPTPALQPAPSQAQDLEPFEEISPSPSISRLTLDKGASEKAQIALKTFRGEGMPRNEERGFASAKEAADSGDGYGALLLGLAYRDGIGVPRDPKISVQWLELAAQKNLQTAQFLLAEEHLYGTGTSRDPVLALSYFSKAAESGNALAQLRAAQMFYLGIGTPRDTARALAYARSARVTLPEADYYVGLIMLDKPNPSTADSELIVSSFRRAGEAGHVLAGLMYGVFLEYGDGVPRDYVAAIPWIRKGADRGVPFAIELLGEINGFGLGVPVDPVKAIGFYNRAAQLLDTNAMVMLGNAYDAGNGVTANSSTAASYWRLAADAGSVAGALNLGWAYLYGRGVNQDTQEGLKWVRQAAVSRPLAQYILGMFYGIGDFVEKDEAQAVFWYSKAADGGYANAQFLLARAYEYGRGVQPDVAKSFYWYSRAADGGVDEARGMLCEIYRISAAGVDWRTPEATPILQAGAEKKQPACIYVQAMRFMAGIQSPQDDVRAIELLRLGAQSKYNRAEMDLATAYWKGKGVPVDMAQSRYWLERAADHGNTLALQLLKDASLR